MIAPIGIERVTSIFFGGGTPSLMEPDVIEVKDCLQLKDVQWRLRYLTFEFITYSKLELF